MKTSKILLALLASIPMLATAGTPTKQNAAPAIEVRRAITYNYVEGGYTGIIPDVGSSSHGGYFEASYSPVNNVFLFGRAAVLGGDDTLTDVALGLGLYVPLVSSDKAPTIDFVVRGGWNLSVTGDDDLNAWFAAPGFRALLSDKLELNTQAFFYQTDEDDNAVALGAGLVYYFNQHLAISANYSYDLDDESHFVQSGVRYMW